MIKLLTPHDVHRRDFDVNDTTHLDPTDADCFDAGEWLYLNTSGKLVKIDGGRRGDRELLPGPHPEGQLRRPGAGQGRCGLQP